MTSCRTIGIPGPLRTLLIASGLTAGLSLAAAAQTAGDALLAPTPLILKDGRIANVSVHVVGFPQGQSALGSATAQDLSLLTDEAATDCFLTAQVIGHVGSSEVAGNDSLNAHRLARARADAVQASLIAGGLPAKAIASVWDWQFMVREARATLWVFRLTPGEDCEGAPLDSAAPALVAQAEARPAPSPGPRPTTEVTAGPLEAARGAPPPRESLAASPASAAPKTAPSVAAAAAPARPALAEAAKPAGRPLPPRPDRRRPTPRTLRRQRRPRRLQPEPWSPRLRSQRRALPLPPDRRSPRPRGLRLQRRRSPCRRDRRRRGCRA